MDKAARAALLTAKGIKKYARGGSAPSKTPVKNPMLQEVYFAGPNAKTFNQVPEERKFKDPTGMQRFEGSDDQASSPIKTMSDYYALLRQPGPRMEGDRAATLSGTTVPLGSLLSHEEMYRDYPQLRETPVFVKPPSGNGSVASYSDAAALASNVWNKTNEVIDNINNEQDMESVHNNIFNSPTGAFTIDNPDSPHFTPTYLQSDEIHPSNDFSDKFLRMLVHESQHAMNSIDKTNKYGSTPEDYERRPTEMEAFFTAHRLNMTPEQRAADAQYMPTFFRQTARYATGGPVNSTGATLDLARAVMAKERAGGQIAPSKYLPGVPRAVHAGGGKVDFVKDNPSGDWLESKQARAAQHPDMKFMTGSITGVIGGRSNMFLPTHILKGIAGLNDEVRTEGVHKYDSLLAGAQKGGFDPDQEGNKVVVGVNHYGQPYLIEGNTRVAVAHAMGVPKVKAEVRYWNGAEEADGPMHPDQVFGMASDSPDITKAGGGDVEGGKASFLSGNHPAVPDVVYHGNAPRIVKKETYLGDGNGWKSEVDQAATDRNISAQDFRTFRPSEYGNYGPGIYLTDNPKTASDYAQGIRADQSEAKPHGQVMKLHVSMKQPFTDDVLRHPAWIDYIKQELTKHHLPYDEDRAARDAILSKLDDGTATVRDMFVRDTPHGTMVNQHGQDDVIKTIRNSGFDGIIAHRPDGSKEIVAFKPEQVKSAIGNQGTFDPTNPDMTKADGGSVTGSENFQSWFGNSVTHTDGEPHVLYTGTSKDKDFTSFNVGRHGAWFTRDPAEASEYAERNDSQGYKYDGWKVIETNTASRVIPAYIKAENPYTGDLPDEVLRDNYKKAQSDWFDTLRRNGHDSWIPARHNGNLVVVLKEPQQIKSIFNNGKFDPNQKHMNRATGGRTVNKLNMYSKAAEVARSLPQAKGSVDQMLAMLRKGGVKPAELEHAGRPSGDMIDRETLAKHFEDALPKVSARQYGEQPFSMTQDENQEYNRLSNRHHASQYRTGAARAEPLSPEEMKRFEDLGSRMRRKDPVSVVGEGEDGGPAETGYHDYQTPGGKDYRERLLTLPKRKGTPSWTVSGPSMLVSREHDTKEAADADAAQMNSRLSPDIHPSRRHRVSETTRESTDNYQSIHWRGDDNVLAHIRMKDRIIGPEADFRSAKDWAAPVLIKIADHMGVELPNSLGSGAADYGVKAGLISPEEAATLSRIKGWSSSPYHDKPGISKRALHIEEIQSDWAQEGRKQGFKPTDGSSAAKDALPNAPYVKNTAHWTDLALKNILAEAAHGRYDHVTFTGGQEQADRYGLEKSLSAIHYTPETKTLHAERIGQHRPIIQQDVAPEQVASYIGSEAANKLLDPSNAYEVGGVRRHSLVDDDLKMGGEGMKGYYDNILPKAAMKLVQQHDPSIQPSTINGNFGFTMTPKARESILQGQPAFAKGGEVDDPMVGHHNTSGRGVALYRSQPDLMFKNGGKAMALTRGFTKNGAGVMMSLKSKGK